MSLNVIVVRPGELTVKGSGARRRFERLLVRNMEDALRSAGFSARVKGGYGRFYVYGPSECVGVLRRVFGIKSLSPALEVEFANLDDLLSKAEDFFREKVAGKSFAVRTRRTGSHTFTSLDVNRLLGERLLKYASKVDLENPEVEVHVEIRENRAYFFTEVVEAYGGLPVGSEGRVVALVSGGFDSIVAAWLALKRGAEVHFLFLNMGGEVSRYYAVKAVKALADNWCYGYRPKLFIADFSELLKELRKKVRPEVLGVILKRYMYRAANAIAKRVQAEGIVTGESLGQVSSQTLQNLNVIDKASDLVVLRPVIGLDKDEITKLAVEIGTYEASSKVKEICGAYSVHPKTACTLEEVIEEEEKVDEEVFKRALERIEELDIRSLGEEEFDKARFESLDIEEIPGDAVIIDVRPPEKYKLEHIPGSLNVDFWDVEDYVARLGREKKYVLVCDEGGLSREVAYRLRELGVEAYSLKGGMRAWKRRAEATRR